MPELPEVETARRGLAPHLEGQTIQAVIIRHPTLRWPVPQQLTHLLPGQRIRRIHRRAKYLLFDTEAGWLILHLGMSGSLRVLPATTLPGKHDHFDLVLASGLAMRLCDPRRFGAVLWAGDHPDTHPLLAPLGMEPMTDDFTTEKLFQALRSRAAPIKQVAGNIGGVQFPGILILKLVDATFAAAIAQGFPLRPVEPVKRHIFPKTRAHLIQRASSLAILSGGPSCGMMAMGPPSGP